MIILQFKRHYLTFDNHEDFHAFVDAMNIFRDTVRKSDYLRKHFFSADTTYEYCTSLKGAFDETSKN